jgi:uncharacterized zinc-type alcohol dehydrogenase-like protein
MSTLKVMGYAAKGVGQQLEPYEYPSPQLGENDVRVSITHCGVCHTDIHAIDDYYGVTPYPFVPGHEIVGHIAALGPAAKGFKEGDSVAIGWQGHSCMQCEWCLKGEPQLCMDVENCGVWIPYGGFATSVVVDHRFVYPLPQGMPPEVAAVLMCAGVTVYAPLRAHATKQKKSLGIVGVGGLGHLALQFAHSLGYQVTAISSSPGKEEQALAFGADHFVHSKDSASMRRVHYAFDLLLCTANHGLDWEELLLTLKKRGKLILLGFPDITLNSTDIVVHELSISGSFVGNPRTMHAMLAFAQQHGIQPMIELMPMSQVNVALQRLRENKARYRIVLVNDLVGNVAEIY